MKRIGLFAAGVVLLVITLTVSLVQRWLFDKEKKK
jgi:multiple sugar transport system permease protein